MQKVNLSIVIPMYNESKRIADTLSKIQKYFSSKKIFFEIILVNDGSTDDTLVVAKTWEKEFKNFYIVNSLKNNGKGHAVKAGMSVATGELRLFMDADSSVDIDNIQNFFTEILKGNDIVIASIYKTGGKVRNGSKIRRQVGKLASRIVKKFFTLPVSDTQRGFKLFTALAAETIFPKVSIHGYAFDIEVLLLAKKLNLKVKEVGVVWTEKKNSKIKYQDYVWMFFEIIRILLKSLYF